jgi:hypothetical protein
MPQKIIAALARAKVRATSTISSAGTPEMRDATSGVQGATASASASKPDVRSRTNAGS